MGIQILEQPQAVEDIGIFNLPPGFNKKKYSASWIEEVRVETMKQRQPMPQCGASTDGLEVWKDKKGNPHIVTSGTNKKYYLMFRLRSVTRQMNAMYGNVTKKQFNMELTGETVDGKEPDPGILTEKDLKRGRDKNPTPEMPLNPVEVGEVAVA